MAVTRRSLMGSLICLPARTTKKNSKRTPRNTSRPTAVTAPFAFRRGKKLLRIPKRGKKSVGKTFLTWGRMFKLNGEKTCQGISGKRTAFGSGSKTRRRLICDEHARSTQLTRTVHDLAMDRIFKRPFLMTGAIAPDRERCQIFSDG